MWTAEWDVTEEKTRQIVNPCLIWGPKGHAANG